MPPLRTPAAPLRSARQKRGEWALFGVTAAWGTTFLASADALLAWPTFSLMAWRFACGTAVLLPWALRRRPSPALCRAGVGLGCLAFAGFSLQTVSLCYTTEAHCAFGTSLVTVFVPLLSMAVLRQPTGLRTLGAIALALVGMLCLLGAPHAVVGGPPGALAAQEASLAGDLLAVGGAVAFAWQILLLQKLATRHPLVPLVVCEMATVTALSFACAWATRSHAPPAGLNSYGVVLYLGLLPTALCLVGQGYGQATTSATKAAFIYALEPLFAAALAWVFHHQRLGPWEIFGGALVVGAALLAEV
jgi:drug/metabolite transporter (DMT)-like permease